MKTARKKKITEVQIAKQVAAKLTGQTSCRSCACLFGTARPANLDMASGRISWINYDETWLHCASDMFEPFKQEVNGWIVARRLIQAPEKRCLHYQPTTGQAIDTIQTTSGNMIARNHDCIPARIRRVIDAKAMEYHKAAKARDQKTK